MSDIPVSHYPPPERQDFPEDEARYPWLKTLLNAYLVVDQGVAEGIKREHKQGRQLACGRGCSACCRTHSEIPVYPLELMGMTWYVVEKLQSPERELLKTQLLNHQEIPGCPFLLEDVCSIHPLRPMACRQFNVFGKVCAEGEDAFYTRRDDVMTPVKKFTDQAFNTMLPFYGIKKKAERSKVACMHWQR